LTYLNYSRIIAVAINGGLAQLVEHRTFNPMVASSILAAPTILLF
jgi:hypothetical protein